MDPARIAVLADSIGLRPHPIVLDTTPSTNDAARMLAMEGAPHGTSVLADHQTKGRGRLGRSWLSAPGQNVLASLVLRPSFPSSRWPLICLAAALATADVCGPRFQIKWPNDIVDAQHRKVAGILAEAEHGAGGFVILGIGIDVGDRPEGVHAVALAEHGERRDRETIAVHLLRAALDAVEQLADRPEVVLDGWRARASTLGAAVAVGSVRGRAVDIDESGALLVDTGGGVIARVLAGDVSMLG